MTVTRRELRLRAQEEAARVAAEAQGETSEGNPTPEPPVTESAPAELVEPVLTRRELRHKRILQETGEIPVVPPEAPAPPGTVDEPSIETDLAPPPPEVSPDEADDVRPTRRRRPVLPPQTTSSMPVIDPETGTIGAVTITFPQSESEPEIESADSPSVAPAVVNLPPLPPVIDDPIDFDSILSGAPAQPKEMPEPPAPAAEPEPTVEETSAVDDPGTPKRTSLFSILNDREGVEVALSEPEDHSNLTVEQLAVHGKSSAAVTFLRYLVLILTMFVIGGVIWLIATRVDAVIVSEGLALVETYGSGG